MDGILKKDIKKEICGKIVLVTGAGGSIGSELCRQLVKLDPKKLILVDHSEYNLFSITEEIYKLQSLSSTQCISIKL